jgi:hypothetical protein
MQFPVHDNYAVVFQFSSIFVVGMLYPYLPFLVEFLMPRLKDDKSSVGKLLYLVSGLHKPFTYIACAQINTEGEVLCFSNFLLFSLLH